MGPPSHPSRLVTQPPINNLFQTFSEKTVWVDSCFMFLWHFTNDLFQIFLRKGLKKIVYGRLGHETAGVRRREQGLKQKQSEMSDPEQCPETDIGVVGSWNSETCDPIPAGLNLGEDGQGDLVVESIEQPGEEEFVIESIDEQPNDP